MRPVLLGVAGGSGSGKTTVVHQLQKRLGENLVLVLALDNYYHDLSHLTPAERDERNFDHPDAIDWTLLREHLTNLANGIAISRPTYSFKSHTRQAPEIVEPKRAILVDGILTLYPKDVRNLMDVGIFVETADDLRFIRRLQRDVRERGRTNENVIQQYLLSVRPMYEKFVAPQRPLANIIVPWEHYNETAIHSLELIVRGLLASRD